MNVLQISSGEGFGGGEKHVLGLSTKLAMRGHKIHVVLRSQSDLWHRLQPYQEIALHALKLKNSLDLISAYQLSKIIANENINIIHAHYGRDYLIAANAVYLFRLFNKRKLGFVITRHHYLPLSSNFLYRFWLSTADAVLAVSKSVQTTICTSLKWPTERVQVIPNWIDTDSFKGNYSKQESRQFFDLPLTEKIIGVINQISPSKGQMEALEAVAKIPNVHLVFAGKETNGNSFTNNLKQKAQELNILNRVHFLGFVNNVAMLLAALDIVAIPSWNEAFSICALEAMIAGIPVVASDTGGLSEIIINNIDGLLVPPHQVNLLNKALYHLLNDNFLYEKIRIAGFKKAKKYESSQIIDEIEKIYSCKS